MTSLFPAASNQLDTLPGTQLERLHPGWMKIFSEPKVRAAIEKLDTFLASRLAAGARIFPAQVFHALETHPPEAIRVVILGQDPYHGPGQAYGLAFSVPNDCATPPSLRNIFRELAREYPDRAPRRKNELSDWAQQGVLLLNASLTVEQASPGSHARKGWETITDRLIESVAATSHPKVFLLWGNHAQAKQSLIESAGGTMKILRANHPSPLSAMRPPRPFIGCGHFSQANAWLGAHGEQAIDWMGT